jgi:hypothetical protein
MATTLPSIAARARPRSSPATFFIHASAIADDELTRRNGQRGVAQEIGELRQRFLAPGSQRSRR